MKRRCMDNFFSNFIPLAIGSMALLLVAAIVLCCHFRRVAQKKNRRISLWMRESVRLEGELNRIRMEKDILDKTLDKFIHQSNGQAEME